MYLRNIPLALAFLFFFLIETSLSSAVTFPATGPSGSYSGGSFGTYFKNIMENPCPTGQVITSFKTGALTYGQPNCTVVNSVELDPKVGVNTVNYLSKWNGSALIASAVYESGGSLGLGTASPQSGFMLDVSGQSVLRNNIYVAGNLNEFSTTNYKLTSAGNSWLNSISGNLGIGTAVPGYKLDVNGGIHAVGQMYINPSTTGQDALRIQPGDDLNPTYNIITLGNAGWSAWPFAVSKNGNIASAGVLSINGVGNSFLMGNVGIGTSAPSTKLDVNGTSTFRDTLTMTSNKSINFQSPGIGSNTPGGFNWLLATDQAGMYALENSSDSTDYVFKLGDNAVDGGDRYVFWQTAWQGIASDRWPLVMNGTWAAFDPRFSGNTSAGSITSSTMYLDYATRNVGIGTQTPGAKLDVAGGLVRQGGYSVSDAATDNLLVNGDFEMGNLSGWTGFDSAVNAGAASPSGTYVAQRAGSNNILSDDYIPVNPSRDVLELEGYFKKSVAGTTSGVLYFGYIAYDQTKTPIYTAPCGTYCYFAASAYVLPADGAWHKLSATTTGEGTIYPNFPIGTKYVRVLVLINYGSSADAVTQIDHVTLRKINNGPIFVGNNYSSTNLVDQYQSSKLYTTTSNNLILEPTANVGIGTATPGQKLDVVGAVRTNNQFISTLVTGTAPLAVSSTTLNTNLNADLLDGYGAGNASGNISISNGIVNTNLNADMVDGYHLNQNVLTSSSPTFSGITAKIINLNRLAGPATGIKYYSSGYKAWQDYMAPAGAGQGVDADITAPTGSLVTSWGLRSFIENSAGYGWTWENGISSSTTPSIVAELSSANGNFRTIGQMTATQFNGPLSGNATTATTANSAGILNYRDIRTISPSSENPNTMRFGFTSFANNNTSPYADFLHLRSYTDASGGSDNLLVFNKSSIGARVYQQAFGSATAYSSYKDFVMTDANSTNVTLAGDLNVQGKIIVDKLVNRTVTNISISGSLLPDAAAPTVYRDIGSVALPWNNLYLNGQIKIAGGTPGVGKVLTSDAAGLATWSGVTVTESDPKVGSLTTKYVPKWNTTSLVNSIIYDTGTGVGISTTNPTGTLSVSGTMVANTYYLNTGGSTLTGGFDNQYSWTWWGSDISNTNTGNVGIGTLTPGAKLEVNGQVKITGGTPGAGKVLTSDAAGLATWTTPASGVSGGQTNYVARFLSATSLGTGAIYDNGTNVGIGTPSPSYKLEVRDTNAVIKSSGTAGYGSFYAQGSGINPAYMFFGNTTNNEQNRITSVDGGTLVFSNGNGATERMRITGSGNVGIGNAVPGKTLDVTGDIRASGELISTNINQARFIYGNYGLIQRNDGATYYLLSTASGDQYGSGNSLRPFSINMASGNVNIGNGAFTVTHGGGVAAATSMQSPNYLVTAANGNGICFWGDCTNYKVSMGNAAENIYGPVTGYSIKTTMNNNAGWGWSWGTPGAVPVAAMSVAGNMQIAGNMTAAAYYYSSDKNLKKNIIPLNNSLEKILNLNGYSFDWKKDGRKDVGVIAQEVEKQFPDLVHTDRNTGLKSVEYGNLVAPIIEAMKEQQKIIDSQNEKIQSLESRLEKIEASLAHTK